MRRAAIIGAGMLAVAAAVLIGLVFAVGHLLMPGDDDLGAHPMDGQTAARAMELRGIVIPDGFTFAEGVEVREFVGANGYYARYRGLGDFADAERAVVAANHDFPAFRAVPCADDSAGRDFPWLADFGCDAGTAMAVTTRSARGVNPAAAAGWQAMDAETLVLAVLDAHVELFAVSTGH